MVIHLLANQDLTPMLWYLRIVQLRPLNPVPIQLHLKVKKRFMHLPPFPQGACLLLAHASTQPDANPECEMRASESL